MHKIALATLTLAAALPTGLAQADRHDDAIASGVLRCAVLLDFPEDGVVPHQHRTGRL